MGQIKNIKLHIVTDIKQSLQRAMVENEEMETENVVEDVRTLEQVKELAAIAGVTHAKGPIQTLSYSTQWMKEDYKLLELNKELLENIQQGDQLVIRGDHNDETVLCSKNKTYELRAADTSNTLLLVPELLAPGSSTVDDVTEADTKLVDRAVLSCFSTYYEVRLIQPRLERLKVILHNNSYSNSSDEDSKEKYTTQQLLGLIQASEEELKRGLNKLGAFEIEGFWRVLDTNYKEKAFSQILALIEEKSWDWHTVPIQCTCDMLHDLYPGFVLEYCLRMHGALIEDENTFEDVEMAGDLYCLDNDKVCRYYAEYILRPALGKFNYHEFLEAWEQSVPDGMKVNEDQLLGIALTDLNTHPPVVWHFPESNLPEDPGERFNVLFRTRPKWKEKDIVPYLENLLAPGQKLSSLFLKYARCSTDATGGKVYNSKTPIS